MISVCFLFFKIPLPRGGSCPSLVIPTGAKHRAQSPLERRPRTISTDRPEMESRPYEFLLQKNLPANARGLGSILGLGRSPRGGNAVYMSFLICQFISLHFSSLGVHTFVLNSSLSWTTAIQS